MRKSMMVGAAITALMIAGCGAATPEHNNASATAIATVPNEGGNVAAAVNALEPAHAPEPKPSPTPTAKATPASWAGTYRGSFDGGRGEVTITEDDETPDYHVKVVTLGEGGCSGEVSTMSTPEGNSMTLNIFTHADPPVCKITLARQGNTLRVSESGCTSQHGMSCAFSGSATKTR